MYAITGITGKVGGALAQTLLSANQPVRAVVRDPGRAQAWAERGCEVAAANMDDAASLAAAFEGAAGVLILPPSEFDPLPGFPEARAVIDASGGGSTEMGRRARLNFPPIDPVKADPIVFELRKIATELDSTPAQVAWHGYWDVAKRPR